MITALMLRSLENCEWGGIAKNRPSYVDRMRSVQAARAEAKRLHQYEYQKQYRAAKKAARRNSEAEREI